MRFSLIMATIERTQEISRFLEKLNLQTYRDFELIIVDQNLDDRLLEIIKPYQSKFSINHLRSKPGLSKARNLGMTSITGDVIAFPDDDCWYPPELLQEVASFLKNNPYLDGLTGCTANENYWDKESGRLTQFNVWKRAISYTVFLRRSVIEKVGIFDETLGVGAGTSWKSGEETDYIIRALKLGFQLHYSHDLQVHHPGVINSIQEKASNFKKSYDYAMGKGRVLRKSNAPLWFVVYQCSKPLVNLILGLIQQNPEKKHVSWAVFQGIVNGWRGLS